VRREEARSAAYAAGRHVPPPATRRHGLGRLRRTLRGDPGCPGAAPGLRPDHQDRLPRGRRGEEGPVPVRDRPAAVPGRFGAGRRPGGARAATLLEAQAVSHEEYEQKQAAERSADADLKAAQANVRARALDLEFTAIRSPIDGRISDKRVSIGDYVTGGQTLLTRVVTLDPIWFSFDGSESFYLKYTREAQRGERASSRYAANPVDIKLADEHDYRWHGQMSFVDNAIDKTSGTIRAHAVLRNPEGFLAPGMFGRARLLGSGAYHAMLIPDEAIVTDQTRRTVFVVGRDGRVAMRNVETGPLVEGLRVIKTGVGPGDQVVLDGLARLRPGAPVRTHLVPIQPRAADDAPRSAPVETPPSLEATVR
jgi:RND family efflux transporter MFP subunit